MTNKELAKEILYEIGMTLIFNQRTNVRFNHEDMLNMVASRIGEQRVSLESLQGIRCEKCKHFDKTQEYWGECMLPDMDENIEFRSKLLTHIGFGCKHYEPAELKKKRKPKPRNIPPGDVDKPVE